MFGQLFEKRKLSAMYLVGLPFLIFPLYYNWGTSHFPVILLSTLLFAWFYLSLLFSKSAWYDGLAWGYLVLFIAFNSFFGNINFSLFLFHLSNLLTWHYSKDRWTYRSLSYLALLALVIAVVLLKPFPNDVRVFVILMHIFGLMMMVFGRMQLRAEEAERKIQEQYRSINLLSAENERHRIGRDLHDTLGHVFAMMTIKTELAIKQLEKNKLDLVDKELRELHQISRSSMQEVRTIVSNLSERRLTEELLQLKEMVDLTGLDLTIDNKLDTDLLLPQTQSNLIMISRELTNNLLKHSQASQARLSLKADKAKLIVEMIDDGKGFKTLNGQELLSIRQRLAGVRGEVEVVSKQYPTKIVVSFEEEEMI